MVRDELKREDVVRAIERTGGTQAPLVFHKWWGNGLVDALGAPLLDLSAQYPDDIFVAWHVHPGTVASPNANPDYRFGYLDDYSRAETHSIGQDTVLLPDWKDLDKLLASFPDPYEPGTFDDVARLARTQARGRYKLGAWWRSFHEQLWGIRGMENLMMDYYDEMDGLKAIGQRLAAFHKGTIDRYAELGFDGIFTSDDLGHQTGPMMSPAIFEELYFPLYKEVIAHAHAKGMHYFLHSCGDNTLLMEYLIEAGLDVLHPVQKGCMDMADTAARYGDRISFLAGMDVQSILPHGSAQEVRDEVRFMKDTFRTERGGLLLAAGNGIMPGTLLENIEAMLDEMSRA